jgi:hypothetical protein
VPEKSLIVVIAIPSASAQSACVIFLMFNVNEKYAKWVYAHKKLTIFPART